MPEPVTQAEQARISDVPASCTCTWSWGPPSFRWQRIGIKEDCPWHKIGDNLMTKVRQP
jgi:hypothetical protein